jgi:hypothetical protein
MTEDDKTTPNRAQPGPLPIAEASTVLQLSATALDEIVEKKATCPFLGTAVATGQLPVRNEASNPLASIEDAKMLGDTGGGDLGSLLVLFAAGNHAFMRGRTDRLDQHVPDGLFSLELPGSQGSHPGHSGILQGDPETLDSGRLSQTDFARLASRAKDGLLKRSDVGRFIAENLHRDPKAKVFGLRVAELLARDLGHFVGSVGPDLLTKLARSDEGGDAAHRDLEQKLTRFLGEDNLIGSAGEFGLLFAFLANKPGAREVDGEPALSLEDLQSMFLDKRFPNGWKTWRKTRLDWVINTTSLMVSAGKEYLTLQRKEEVV